MWQQLVYKNISVIPVIYLLVMYTMFSMSLSEITKKEKRKDENKFECFRQVVA